MKKVIFVLLLCTTVLTAQNTGNKFNSPNDNDYIGESEYFIFYSNYWLNMHHFLNYNAVIADTTKAMYVNEELTANLTEDETGLLEFLVRFYREELISKDLRSSDYMQGVKEFLIYQTPDSLKDIPPRYAFHLKVLDKFSPVYKAHFWDKHNGSNKAILQKYKTLLESTETGVVDELTELTKEFWDGEKIRVDITYRAKNDLRNKRDRPFTSVRPTHVVMNSAEDEVKGNWLELLYHEASHHLISPVAGFIGGTINNTSEVRGLRVPRGMWHAYLFYLSGKVTQSALAENGMEDYEMYMVRNNVFSWFMPYFNKHMPGYIAREVTLEETTRLIMEEMEEARKNGN